MRCRVEEKNTFEIFIEDDKTGKFLGRVFSAEWDYNGAGYLFIKAGSYGELPVEEVEYFLDWFNKTKPTKKYMITTLFDFEPDYCEVSSDTHGKITGKPEVKEVWR